jgi:hypothetical protein
MKMKIVMILAALALASTANAARISTGNAGELGAHRIEKLVLLKKIPNSFTSQFKGLEVKSITPGGVGLPSFEIVGSIEADAGKVATKVSVILDENGKAVSEAVSSGSAATKPTVWSGNDPLTLTELSVHHLEHLMTTDAKVAPFYNGMKAMRISAMGAGPGMMAMVEVVSNLTAQTLTLSLKTDGSLINYQIK